MSKNNKNNIYRFPGNNKAPNPGMQSKKAMNMQTVDASKMDPQVTINVRNDKAIELMALFNEEKSNGNLTNLINELVKCRVLVPVKMNEQKSPVPLSLRLKDGELFQAIFTDKDKMPPDKVSDGVLNMPFVEVVKATLKFNANITGMVINPFSQGVMFKRELLEKIQENTEKAQKVQEAMKAIQNMDGVELETVTNEDGKQVTQLKMTEEQYVKFERGKFEMTFLPARFLDTKADFVKELCSDKEEFIDRLYEESYQNKRMYPYLLEEFQVMAMKVSDTTEIVYVKMPERDMNPGAAEGVYFVWDEDKSIARYFAKLASNKPKVFEMVEVEKPGELKHLGEAPSEGNELNWIIDQLG